MNFRFRAEIPYFHANPSSTIRQAACLLQGRVTDPLNDLTPLELSFLPTWAPGDGTILGFEDIFGGADEDYNDLVYSFTNIADRQVPSP